MIDAMTPKPPGRKALPEAQAKLRAERERLKRENDKLKTQVGSTHQMLELVADIFNRRIDRAMSARESKPKAKKASPDDDAEEHLRALVDMRRSHHLRMVIAASLVGISTATARRWAARKRAGLPLRSTRPHHRTLPSPDVVSVLDARVRGTHGLIGADALRTCAAGVSRRQAADIKHSTLTAMERERVARAVRIHVEQPGIVRGMDGMYIMTTHAPLWLLLFGDSSVAYRTSAHVTATYDSQAVMRAIDDDFRRNGAPLGSGWTVRASSAHPKSTTSSRSTACSSCTGHRAIPASTGSKSARIVTIELGSTSSAHPHLTRSVHTSTACSMR